ncbi:arsenate reductase [Terrimicrobium sacchariphilum]|uniref:Arsenate reductase n=1 Tax=Terrimicrobium sacchariphilum TaxID=690879 RepID=A0A146G916_TERSA|nr:Spx/MgsR family RNA polymerase-binding regulatory protein [Terrimicrobium sacchariphilum]GAT34179.1 arsenate reductase [Terrimicrobium sacchariphilum]
MKILKAYTYSGCGTCKKAVRFLRDHGVAFEEIPIREHPPTEKELKGALQSYKGEVRRLFNTSGRDYKEMELSKKLPSLSEAEAIALLAGNGNLVKRPFVVLDSGYLVGFNETDWAKIA